MKRWILLAATIVFNVVASAQTPDEILSVKGIELPSLPQVSGSYIPLVKSGTLVFLSGRGPLQGNGVYLAGKLGRDLDSRQGYAAARLSALAQLATLKAEFGNLYTIKRIVKITVFVNGTDSFTEQATVANGCSDLLLEVFGKNGVHARSAIGVSGLPSGWPVEIEMIVETYN